MCNLFTARRSAAEVAAHFDADDTLAIDVPEETVPHSPGLVVREARGRRVLQSMGFGFPRLTREMRERGVAPTPVNLVANLHSPMWQPVVEDRRYRCIIPFTHFAEPNGYPGSKTRSWFRVDGEPLYGWAGFCRNTETWGPVFAGMTTDSNADVAELNPRMPVLLGADEVQDWFRTDVGGVMAYATRPFPVGKLIREDTADLWIKRDLVPDPQMGLGL